MIANQPPPSAVHPVTAERRLGQIDGYQHCLRVLLGLCSVEVADEMKSALQKAAEELELPGQTLS